jgi:hypothetical protein
MTTSITLIVKWRKIIFIVVKTQGSYEIRFGHGL